MYHELPHSILPIEQPHLPLTDLTLRCLEQAHKQSIQTENSGTKKPKMDTMSMSR